MTSLTSKIQKVRDVLTLLDIDVYHYRKPAKSKTKRYVVWSEDGASGSFSANNRQDEQQVTGSVDLYTQVEYDSVVDEIQDALNEVTHGSWSLNSVAYEDETEFIHYEWIFSVG